MARRRRGIQSRVRLRPLTRAEQRVLRGKLRDLKLPARLHRRYQIVAARAVASVPAVAQRVGCDVRSVTSVAFRVGGNLVVLEDGAVNVVTNAQSNVTELRVTISGCVCPTATTTMRRRTGVSASPRCETPAPSRRVSSSWDRARKRS